MIKSKKFKKMKFKYVLCIYIFINEISLTQSAKKFNEKNLPIVMWWTETLFPYETKTKEIQCSSGRCLSTKKRKHYNDSDPIAFLFYGTDFKGTSLPLPRKNNHIWGLLHEESPLNNYIFSHSTGIKLFNFSATFSRYSDFPLTTQHLPTLEYLSRKPIALNIKNEFRRNGTAPILYLQSHCNVPSDRDRYVQNLMKFIRIDSLGSCLHNKEMPFHLADTDTHNDEALFEYISRYKFHLAFENAICDDYITEKFFRALHVGSVPIYRGSPSIEDWLPDPFSGIIVDKFENPKELAKFVSELDESDELYEKYLTFKQKITNDFLKEHMMKRIWGVNNPYKTDFLRGFECFLCDQLLTLNKSSPSIANRSHMNCHQPRTSLNLNTSQPIKSDKWLKENWPEAYWFGLDQAKAIELMLKNKESDTSNFWKYLSN